MNNIVSVTTPNDLDRITAAVAQIAPWLLPLYRAVQAGEINLITPHRSATIRKAILTNNQRPCIILLGDDDYQSTGPAVWACARRVKACEGVEHPCGRRRAAPLRSGSGGFQGSQALAAGRDQFKPSGRLAELPGAKADASNHYRPAQPHPMPQPVGTTH